MGKQGNCCSKPNKSPRGGILNSSHSRVRITSLLLISLLLFSPIGSHHTPKVLAQGSKCGCSNGLAPLDAKTTLSDYIMSLIKGTGGECGGDQCSCEKDCSGSQPECGGAITCANSGCSSEGCNCPETYCDSSKEDRNFSCEIRTVVCFSDGCGADSCLIDNCPEYCANYEGNKYPCGGTASICNVQLTDCICSSCDCVSYCSLGDLPCFSADLPDCTDDYCGCGGNKACEGDYYKEGTCDCPVGPPDCNDACGCEPPKWCEPDIFKEGTCDCPWNDCNDACGCVPPKSCEGEFVKEGSCDCGFMECPERPGCFCDPPASCEGVDYKADSCSCPDWAQKCPGPPDCECYRPLCEGLRYEPGSCTECPERPQEEPK